MAKQITNPKSLRNSLLTFAAIGIFLVSSLSHAKPDAAAGNQLRSFLTELITASQSAPKDRARYIRTVFVDHPELFRWFGEDEKPKKLLSAAGLQDIKLPISGDKEILQEIQELAKNEIRDWAKNLGANHDIANAAQKLLPSLAGANPASDLAKNGAKLTSKIFSDLPREKRAKALEAIHDRRFEEIGQKLDQVILDASLSDSDAVRRLTRSGALQYDQMPIPGKEISKFVNRYFDALDIKVRKNIVLGLLELPPGAQAEAQLSVFIQRAGPALQKFFQLAGRNADSPILQKVMKELHAHITPFPTEEARAIIEKSLGDKIENLFLWFDDKPLNAGTIGQVHKAKLKNGQDVVVKVRRPGIMEAVEREIEVARKVAKGTAVEGMVEQLYESLKQELNFIIEAANLDKAVVLYSNPKKGIEIPARIKDFKTVEDVLIVEMAKGMQPEDMRALLLRRGEALSAMLEQWIDVAIFQDGFFHSDMHPGNEFFERIINGDPDLLIHPIDFGNSGELKLVERRAFMQLSLGAMANSPERMMEAVLPLAPKITNNQKKAVLKAIQKLDLTQMQTSKAVEQFLSIMFANGIKLEPPSLINFQRGKLMLEGQIADINKSLDKVDKFRKLRRFEPEAIYIRVAARRLGVDAAKQLFSAKARENTIAPLPDLTRALLQKRTLVDAYFAVSNSCLVTRLKTMF